MKEVHWKSLITELEGHGQPIEDEAADRWAEGENKKDWADFYHWTVRVI